MKSVTFFFISALVFIFITPSSIATDADDIVYDASGNELQVGVSYIISPPIWGPLGGSLKLTTPLNNETCDADVIQNYFDTSSGTPFTFTSINPNEDVIKLGVPVAIQSPTENTCGTSTIWKVSTRSGLSGHIITTGGIIDTPDSCLRIVKPQEKFGPFSYMFEYCPNMCGAGPKICYTLGVQLIDNYRYLSTAPTLTFPFIFMKESEAAKIKLVSSTMKQM